VMPMMAMMTTASAHGTVMPMMAMTPEAKGLPVVTGPAVRAVAPPTRMPAFTPAALRSAFGFKALQNRLKGPLGGFELLDCFCLGRRRLRSRGRRCRGPLAAATEAHPRRTAGTVRGRRWRRALVAHGIRAL
jgi:hypothetical protein